MYIDLKGRNLNSRAKFVAKKNYPSTSLTPGMNILLKKNVISHLLYSIPLPKSSHI
jgi:hypothetical protein